MEYIIIEIKNLLRDNQFLSGGVMLGLLASIFYPLKSLPITIWNKIQYYFTYKIHIDQSDDAYNVFSQWFAEKYPNKFRNVEIRFFRNKSYEYDMRKSNKGWRFWKYQYIDSNFIWYKKRLLLISKKRKELESPKDLFMVHFNSYEVSGFFAKNAIDLLCSELIDIKCKEEHDTSICIFIPEHACFRKSSNMVIKDFKDVFFKEKESYLKELDDFINKKDFYASKGITYKKSYLLHGPGGTGKTTIATATAKYLEYDLYIMNLHSIRDDNQLIQLAASIPPKSLVLFEDIDCYFKNRDVKNENINFSTILNVFDGAYSPSDCVFIMTTNKLEELDSALIRKGRVSRLMHIDYPRVEDVEYFMSNFYEQPIKLKIKTFDKPMVDVQEICLNFDVENAIRQIESCSEKAKAIGTI